MMKYRSTRSSETKDQGELSFEQVTLAGLARDGGLYVPTSWPHFDESEIAALQGKSYSEVAFKVLQPFVAGSLSDQALQQLVDDTYGPQFAHKAIAPLVQYDSNQYMLELFHGPTLAFKDFALQLLGRLFDYFTGDDQKKITILGATSGDTGSAAIEATRGRSHVSIFMLHPKGRVSEVQRRQMTTVKEDNVVNLAVGGTFDDCQALVKECFNDLSFRDQSHLTAVNSINWARVMAQIVYYFTASVSLGAPQRDVNFVVPTGNFGDIYAGYIAKKMGLPIGKLVIATNNNDILSRTYASGRYEKGQVSPTWSPSMDIQVSSNFERLIYDLSGGDGFSVAERLKRFDETGSMALSDSELSSFRDIFDAAAVSDEETKQIMQDLYQKSGMMIDPHTAVGVGAAEKCLSENHNPTIVLSTAHPAKFGEQVREALDQNPPLPDRLSDLLDKEEFYEYIENNGEKLRHFITKSQAI